MIEKKKIVQIVSDYLQNTEHFIVEVKVKNGNKITIILDSDNSITVKDCISVSREVEGSFDREEEDFSLDVTSYGITNPLIMKRQFHKNVGRNVKLQLKDGDVLKGKMTEADEEKITLEVAKSKKKKGQGAEEVLSLLYADIDECKVEISF